MKYLYTGVITKVGIPTGDQRFVFDIVWDNRTFDFDPTYHALIYLIFYQLFPHINFHMIKQFGEITNG